MAKKHHGGCLLLSYFKYVDGHSGFTPGPFMGLVLGPRTHSEKRSCVM